MEAPAGAAAKGTPFRTDIQALRAIAVGAVLTYHLWPDRASGGYVGVDVFFVISGFLITSHLLRTLERTGWISLSEFWARRARRLVPLASVVLLLTLVSSLAWMPPSTWLTTIRGAVASTLYVENWNLARDAVNYLAKDQATGPVQQYWSLSVEEQFYLVWPLLLLGGVLLVRAVHRSRPVARHVSAGSFDVRRVAFVVVVAVAVLSLAFSFWQTAANPSVAYFSTFTRSWEFAAGALLAFVPARLLACPGLEGAQAVVSWLGAALVLGATFLIPAGAPFPGWVALAPVLGAMLFITAGTGRVRLAPGNLGRIRAVERIGDLSYGIYLWHWPLIVILPHALGRELSLPLKLGILVASVALAAASKPLIEDRIRFAPRWQGGGLRGFVPGAVAMALVLVGALVPYRSITTATDSGREGAVPPLPGVSPSLDEDAETSPAPSEFAALAVVPGIAVRAEDRGPMYDCFDFGNTKLYRCDYGPADASVKIAITGDSHAAHLTPGLIEAAEQEGWRLSTFVGMSCDGGEGPGCAGGREMEEILSTEDFDVVLATGSRQSITPVEHLREHWTMLRDAGANLVLVEDVPFHPLSAYDCIDQSNGTAGQAVLCATTRGEGIDKFPDRNLALAEDLGVPVVVLRDIFCDEAICTSVVGNVLVYQDSPSSHLTATMSRQLSAFWAVELSAMLEALGPS